MYRKWFALTIVSMVCPVLFQCNNNPSEKAGGDITGSWIETSYNGETIDETFGSENVILLVIDELSFAYHTLIDDCYDMYSSGPYSLSGNKILGDEFTYSETSPDYTHSVSTTYSISGDKLTIKVVSRENGETYTETLIYKRHSGAVPPSTGWTKSAMTFQKRRCGICRPFLSGKSNRNNK